MTNPLDRPDTVEWSIRWPDGQVDTRRYTQAGARRYAADLGAEVVARSVGPWAPSVDSEQPRTPPQGDRIHGDDHGPQTGAQPARTWKHWDDDGDQIRITPADPDEYGPDRLIVRAAAGGVILDRAAAASLHTWLSRQLAQTGTGTPEAADR